MSSYESVSNPLPKEETEAATCPACEYRVDDSAWVSCGKCKGTFCSKCVREIMVTQGVMDVVVPRCNKCIELYEPCDGCGFLSCDLKSETDHNGEEEFVTGSFCEKCRTEFGILDEAAKAAFYREVEALEETAAEIFGPIPAKWAHDSTLRQLLYSDNPLSTDRLSAKDADRAFPRFDDLRRAV